MTERQQSPGRTAIVVQARMRSTRLPGKVLLDIGGRPVLDVLVERLRRIERADLVVIATTRDAADDRLADFAAAHDLVCVRGSEDDVLSRFMLAAREARAGVIVRVTSDCPLIDPADIDRLLAELAGAPELEFIRNQAGEERTIPRGLDVEILTRSALERADAEATEPLDREHVMPYLYREPGRFRTRVSPPPGPDLSHLRLTIDTPEDLALVDRVVTELGPDASVDEVAAFLEAHPDVARLNASVSQKALESDGDRRRRRIDGKLLLGRADASAATGAGHVARIASLLGAWVREGGRAALVSAALPTFWGERMRALGVDVEEAPASFAELASDAVARGAAAACVDGYAYTLDDVRTLSIALPVVRIDDDVGDVDVPADVVVDPNLGAVAGPGPAESPVGGRATRVLAGGAYALLRPEFDDLRPWAEGAASRVLVTFGSSDPARVTVRCVEALVRHRAPGTSIAVVAGPSMHEDDVASLAQLADSGAIELHRDVTDMPTVLRTARVGVTAAGTTILELLATGCVPLSVRVADNQDVSGQALADSGLGFDHGPDDTCDFDAIARTAFELLADEARLDALSRRGMAAVDRRGVRRILDAALDAIERRSEP
ncbi:MAG: NTP transferase domain-containing protein [Planctomycetota bacterium]